MVLTVLLAAASSVAIHALAEKGGSANPTHEPPHVVGPLYNNETSVVLLPDGVMKIFFVDEESGVCKSAASADSGKTWSEPTPEFTTPVGTSYNTLTLLDSEKELHLFMLVQRGNGRDLGVDLFYDIWHCRTNDQRTKWGDPKRIFAGYVGSIRSIIQLRNGRIVFPVGEWIGNRPAKPPNGANEIVILYSDDVGETWRASNQRLTTPVAKWGHGIGAVEPSIVEMRDGRLWMLIRNDTGKLFESHSNNGIEWSPTVASRFASSESPPNLLRLSDDRLVLFWNNCLEAPATARGILPHYSGRDALHSAISDDDGRAWRGFREVYRDPRRNEPPPRSGDRGTAYPRAAESPDGSIVVATGQGEGHRSIVRFHPDWLYEAAQSDDFSHGLEQWHVFRSDGLVEYVWKNRVAGAQLVRHPSDSSRKALRLRKQDEGAADGAIWNFPCGWKGRLDIQMMLPANSGGAEIALLDQMVEPNAEYEVTARVFQVKCSEHAKSGRIVRFHPNKWQQLSLEWDLDQAKCFVSLDGKSVRVLAAARPTEHGISYVSWRSTSESTTESGLLIDNVAAASKSPVTSARSVATEKF